MLLVALIAVVWGPTEVRSQSGRLHTLDETIYDYVERLQLRGHLLELNPTAAPYSDRALRTALETIDRSELSQPEAGWVERIRRRLDPTEQRLDLTEREGGSSTRSSDTHGETSPSHPSESERTSRAEKKGESDPNLTAGITGTAGAVTTVGRRLSVLRPLGDEIHAYPFAELGGLVAGPRWAASASLRHDLYYDRDPDGIDAVKRFMLRSENTYAGYEGDVFSVYLGRYARHWGALGDPSTMLSANPRTFDHLALRLGSSTLSVRGLLGELDSMNEDGTFTGRAGGTGESGDGIRRFFAGHRWDWRPSRSLQLTLMETAIYSGPGASPSLKWANPLQPFLVMVDNVPKNDENNGLVGLMLWARSAPVTFHGQLLVDDVDLKGVAGEPASIAALGTVTWAGAAPRLDLKAILSMVAARAYNAPQGEGRYMYLNRGLAGQFSDYVRAGLAADWYASGTLSGLWISPRVELLLQGEADYHQPYPPNRGGPPTVLAGQTYRRAHLGVGLRYRPNPYWSIRLEPGLNLTSDADHVADRSSVRPSGRFELHLRFPWRTRPGR